VSIILSIYLTHLKCIVWNAEMSKEKKIKPKWQSQVLEHHEIMPQTHRKRKHVRMQHNLKHDCYGLITVHGTCISTIVFLLWLRKKLVIKARHAQRFSGLKARLTTQMQIVTHFKISWRSTETWRQFSHTLHFVTVPCINYMGIVLLKNKRCFSNYLHVRAFLNVSIILK